MVGSLTFEGELINEEEGSQYPLSTHEDSNNEKITTEEKSEEPGETVFSFGRMIKKKRRAILDS